MAYRDDVDGFASRRARDDCEAEAIAAFRRGERVRRGRGLASWLCAFVATCGLLVVSATLSTDRPTDALPETDVRVPRPPRDLAAERAEAERRRCVTWALREYDRDPFQTRPSDSGLFASPWSIPWGSVTGSNELPVGPEQLVRDCLAGAVSSRRTP